MKCFSKSLVCAALIGAAGMAQAQFYGGLSLGQSRYEISCEGTTACSNSATAVKGLLGYSVTPSFSLEAAYLDAGRATASDAVASYSVKQTAAQFGGAYTIPFDRAWEGVLRTGLSAGTAKVSATVPGVGSASESETNNSWYGAVALNYNATSKMKLSFGYDYTQIKFGGESRRLDLYSLGALYKF